LEDREIGKFLQWGNGNLETAINYYYQKKEKENKSKPKTKEPTSLGKNRQVNALSKITQAQVKQSRTEAFISRIREEYKLPIKGRNSLESNSNVSQ